MVSKSGIRIQNIYYMLSYAYTVLRHNGYEKLGEEDFQNSLDLLSAILVKGMANQVKRGLYKSYVPMEEPLSSLRGKIDIAASIKGQTMLKKRLVCHYDEFSEDIKFNQIIKTTSQLLLKNGAVPQARKKELKKLLMYFQNVKTLDPYSIDWKMRFHRNNATYEMLLAICRLIIFGLLQSEKEGKRRMENFLDERELNKLFEHFILGYYKVHLPSCDFKVNRKQPLWVEDDGNFALLPRMETDAYIKNKHTGDVLILDAKFYKHIMRERHGVQKYNSNHLYQVFAYVKNEQIAVDKAWESGKSPEEILEGKNQRPKVSGVLIYAQTDHEAPPYSDYSLSGNKISLRSLDLREDFSAIRKQLDMLVNTWKKGG